MAHGGIASINCWRIFQNLKISGRKRLLSPFQKKDVNDSFALRESAKFDVIGRELRLEKLKTRIEMRQPLRFQGVTKQVTISKRAGKYFASILVETKDYNPNDADREPSVG